MSKSNQKNAAVSAFFTGQKVVYGGIIWAVSALLFFLLFGVGEERPQWYTIGTYIFEQGAFFAAALLCLRNWSSPQIASGKNVWLGIGLGTFCYGFGSFLFGFWEQYWGLDPAVSPGDLFFMLFYVLVGWGMTLAILPRKINLERWQWLTILGIGTVGIAIGAFLTMTTPAKAAIPPIVAQAPAATPGVTPSVAKPTVTTSPPVSPVPTQVSPTPITTPRSSSPVVFPTVTPSQGSIGATPKSTSTAAPKSPAIAPEDSKATPSPKDKKSEAKTSYGGEAPEMILNLEKQLESHAQLVSLIYVVADVFLLIMATTLLLTFWGGRFAQSWRMVAAASFCMYIADMWFKYASDRIPDYQSGFVLEVFWVFSGVLFGIGAALEYDNSIRTRRGGRKRV